MSDYLSFKCIGLIGNYDFLNTDPLHGIGYRYFNRRFSGLEIIKPDVFIIKKPKYLLPDYIKNGQWFWNPDIKMMRKICRKLKSKK
jgi:hypothetical protein